MSKHSKQIAIVTGAARGIGNGIALRLVQEDYTIVAVDVDEANLGRLCEETDADRIIPRVADVGDPSLAKALVQELDPAEIKLLVNNAGVRWVGSVLDATDEEWEATLRINLSGAFYLMREVGRVMANSGQGGLIVNVASVGGLVGFSNRAGYCASKGGLVMLTKAAALDLASSGVRVVAICPGVINTTMTPENAGDFVQKQVPLGKAGLPKDIAQVVVDLTKWPLATGTTVVVDGGLTTGIRL